MGLYLVVSVSELLTSNGRPIATSAPSRPPPPPSPGTQHLKGQASTTQCTVSPETLCCDNWGLSRVTSLQRVYILHVLKLHILAYSNKLFGILFFFFNCMFYQLIRVQLHSCSSTQSWGSVLPSIVESRDQNSRVCPLLISKRNLGSFCA